ncbi:DUF4426 domain-containing protein [Simiduia aestuariiviva]|uniref:DUF4426 domain-containing protein n=1 Tax=Simiduia aestuariiviva TaxID=1510459 RepID=A0A839UJW9_9GAMM|nr:DUF4426 domain-containing protein [Simiduia aestuariiviva]MBB3166910.1 hypothetical protein [Simiduia aestuariiviva]
MKATFAFILLSLLMAASVHAQPEAPMAVPVVEQPWHDQGDYRVHFSTFTSDFLQPAAARALDFTRANNRVIVNIALTQKRADGSYGLGQAATVKGTATNLMQQQKTLAFKPVVETDATYYLAELRFTNEEVMHFAITLQTPSGDTIDVKFARKLYVNNQ